MNRQKDATLILTRKTEERGRVPSLAEMSPSDNLLLFAVNIERRAGKRRLLRRKEGQKGMTRQRYDIVTIGQICLPIVAICLATDAASLGVYCDAFVSQ